MLAINVYSAITVCFVVFQSFDSDEFALSSLKFFLPSRKKIQSEFVLPPIRYLPNYSDISNTGSGSKMGVANSEDSCNSNDSPHGINHSFAISTERTVFGRMSVEAPVSALSTVTKHSNTLHPNRQERAQKETLGTYHAHHRRCVVEKVLRSYSCSSSNEGRRAFSSLPASSSKRRFPLTSIATQKKLESSSTLRRAVLPRRRRLLCGEKYAKRFGHSVVAKHDLVEIMLQRAMADTTKGGKLAEEFLRRDCLGVDNSGSGCTRTTYSDAVGREGTQGFHTNNDDIDSATIFRQLNILKRGGYWKYLLREDAQEEEQHWDEERLNRFRKEANKENFPRASHPNTRIAYRSQREWEWDDEEDYEEEGRTHRNSINLFVGSALKISNTNDIDIKCIGFRVHTVTKDGWMCSSEQFCCGNNNCNGATGGSTKQQQQQQHLVLLHLPGKLAVLGRQGMCIRGMDLMKRRDNGAVEPHTHHLANTGNGNGHGILGDHPSTATDHLLLFGRISL